METRVEQKVLYTCRKCGIGFSHRSRLYYHQIHAHTKTADCRICGKKFGVGGPLTLHLRTHTETLTQAAARQCKKKLLDSQKAKWNKDPKCELKEEIKCDVCKKTFMHRGALFMHYKTHNYDLPMVRQGMKCDVCRKTFTHRGALAVHYKSHNRDLPMALQGIKCDVCKKTFTHRGAFVMHYKSHNRDHPMANQGFFVVKSGERYKCLTCGSHYANKFGARRHAKARHFNHLSFSDWKPGVSTQQVGNPSSNDTKNTYKCVECLTAFKSELKFQHHILAHSGLKKYRCKKCDLGFKSTRSLTNHERCHQAKRIYKCTLCSASFSIRSRLTRHLKMHEDPNYGCCMHCKFFFFDDDILKRHIKARHTSKLQFECAICRAQFKQAGHLRQHVTIHDQQLLCMQKKNPTDKNCKSVEEEKPNIAAVKNSKESAKNKFRCLECGLEFKSSQGLQHHSVKHMAVAQCSEPKESNVGKSVYKCMECLVVSTTLVSFRRHILSHSGVKRHECKECGIRYERKDYLNRHVIHHTTKAQFKCDQCSASYTTVASLDLHLQRHKDPSYGNATCMHCKFEFFSNKILQRHIEVRHTSKLAIECKICTAQFSKKLHLIQHNEIHNEQLRFAEEKSQSKCLLLNTQLQSSHNLCQQTKPKTIANKHAQSKSLIGGPIIDNQDVYECVECLKNFKNKSSYKHHILSHSGLKFHECKECGLLFAEKYSLQIHEKFHVKKQPYQCNMCTASYATIYALSKHKERHNDPNSGIVTCKHCKFFFRNSAVLECHILARHSKKLQVECNVCHSQFEKIEDLYKHLDIHAQLLNQKTADCNEQDNPLFIKPTKGETYFLTKPRLVDCSICLKSFGHLASLKYHIQNVHLKTHCSICYLFFDNRFLSPTSGQRNLYVCSLCSPSKEKKSGRRPCGVPVRCRLDSASVSQLVAALLYVLIDKEVLKSDELVDKPVDLLLQYVVEVCGQTPVKDEVYSADECMVENLKLLFALSVGEAAASTLLQFKSVNDILCCVLTPFYM